MLFYPPVLSLTQKRPWKSTHQVIHNDDGDDDDDDDVYIYEKIAFVNNDDNDGDYNNDKELG